MSWVFDEEVLAVLAAIAIIAAIFAASQTLYAGRVIEPFSELGLLGPYGKIGDYPRNVVAGSPFQLNIYVGNHEGRAIYYRILMKIGNESSVINASTPLSAEPIMDVRVVLGHNSSKIIPISVTLYEPAVNARLVFEMWVYDEDSGIFKYHGRWNQLWINVTGPDTSVSPQKHYGALSLNPGIESKIAEAYVAIRRAERAGGDTSEMITLLNSAIESASRGDLEDAEKLLEAVALLEPKVTEAGVKLSRLKFYATITGLAIASSACILLYLYLRSNIWLLWAMAHKEWRVTWCGKGEKKGDGCERKCGGSANLNYKGQISVADMINGPRALNPNPRAAARELYRMVKAGVIRIYDPKPPKTFSSFLVSRYNAGFISASLILALGIICIYISEPLRISMGANSFHLLLSTLSAAVIFMRYALGSIIVLFLPGYSLVEALYPSEGDLSPLERLALSIGLSLALVPLVGLILNYTPWGIRLNPVIAAISALTILLLLVSAYRKLMLLKSRVSTNYN
ncbi:MAG: DUF1616 domain-containing protein [Candidatus Bathyarchaeia archaeon]|nr:DUF1616 domain-containing protein [Candidatus Bathyarchaeota archaeon]